MRDFIGRGNYVWFIGVIEDINDPIELGRARVRCYGWHTEDKGQIPTDCLPWAQVMSPTTSASVSGVGTMPMGLVQGSWVVGFFIDGERAQEPMIIGSLPAAPSSLADTQTGFNDPDGVYPKYINESDINRLARGVQTKPHTPDAVIGEPDDPFSAQYPNNGVMETKSGHVKEYDDTPDHERIRELHKSGTFYEVHPDGKLVTHVVKERYTVIASDDAVHVKGNVNIVVDGQTTIDCSNVRITGDVSVGGDVVTDAGVSLNKHKHTDTAGLAAGITTKPNT